VCSFYLDLFSARWFSVRVRCRIPMVCGLKPEVPFGNPGLSFNIHSARRSASTSRSELLDGFSCSSSSLRFSCQKTAQGLALKTG
jgi:hypothetical protein